MPRGAGRKQADAMSESSSYEEESSSEEEIIKKILPKRNTRMQRDRKSVV